MLSECKTGRDLRNYVEHHPAAHDIRQRGSHVTVKGPRPGTAVIPDHGNEQLQRGTLGSVIRMLIGIGLGILLVIALTYGPLSAGF